MYYACGSSSSSERTSRTSPARRFPRPTARQRRRSGRARSRWSCWLPSRRSRS